MNSLFASGVGKDFGVDCCDELEFEGNIEEDGGNWEKKEEEEEEELEDSNDEEFGSSEVIPPIKNFEEVELNLEEPNSFDDEVDKGDGEDVFARVESFVLELL